MGRGGRAVELLANGLLARGVQKGDAFGSRRNTLEWALFDFALGHVGAIGAAIYANSSPHDVHYVLEHLEAVGVLCEDDEQRAKVEEERSRPALRHVLTYGGLPPSRTKGGPTGKANPRPSTTRWLRSTRRTFSRSSTRRGRPAAQGLHDPASELLRDGRRRRRAARPRAAAPT